MIKSLPLLALMLSNALCSYAFHENKDSVLAVLLKKVRTEAPQVLDSNVEEIKFQTFSYLGYIINDDSIPTNRIVTVQTYFKNDSIDKKILIFDQSTCIGYFCVKASLPQKILNFRYLIFPQMTTDINDRLVRQKINFSQGIPQKFQIEKEQFHFIPTTSLVVNRN